MAADTESTPPPSTKAKAAKGPKMRTWTSTSGAKLKASYVETKLGRASLRGADGKIVVIPINRLSAADQAWIKKQAAAAEGTGKIMSPKKPNHLPVFADGTRKGQHAVYTARNFDALMDATGVIKVYPKEKGERVGKPMRYHLRCWYRSSKTKPPTFTHRRVASYTQTADPRIQPDSITLMGTLEDDVPFTVNYEFSEKGITAWGHCKDPAGIDTTQYRVGVNVPASHRFEDDTPLDERARILKGWQLVVDPIEGKTIKYAYADSIPRMNVMCKSAHIDAPLYGRRQIRFSVGDEEEAPLRPYIYSGYSPWQGYFIGMYKDEQDDRSRKLRFTMEIK